MAKPQTLDEVMADAGYLDLRTPVVAVGDAAPDFELPLVDGGGSVRLSELNADRPVALVFGSYTWPPFRAQVGTLDKLAAEFGGRVAFLAVYIREAHPADAWVLDSNRDAGIAFDDPETEAARAGVAATCVMTVRLQMPMVVDGVDDAVASAYGGWPDRLYLVGAGGRIVYQGGEGPFGFEPDELADAIARELAG